MDLLSCCKAKLLLCELHCVSQMDQHNHCRNQMILFLRMTVLMVAGHASQKSSSTLVTKPIRTADFVGSTFVTIDAK